MIDARATEPTIVFLLNAQDIMSGKYNSYPWHLQMLKNLLLLSSRRSLTLSLHIFYIKPKKIRERVSYYLSGLASSLGTTEFDIPFNREQFADYLNVDRTALSKELSNMMCIRDRDDPLFEHKYNVAMGSGRPFRILNTSWWKQELPTDTEIEEARVNLGSCDYKVDYVITHCASNIIQLKLCLLYTSRCV